ncbi:hypothetical protein, partial [Stenotrophomonas maltophilia group sp. Smal35]|uniref:hypothetical protein n=1 Tax=Stenotrophomonas maltophilia group sp. Smal35 TaxID=3377163 RepID=UPI00255605EF
WDCCRSPASGCTAAVPDGDPGPIRTGDLFLVGGHDLGGLTHGSYLTTVPFWGRDGGLPRQPHGERASEQPRRSVAADHLGFATPRCELFSVRPAKARDHTFAPSQYNTSSSTLFAHQSLHGGNVASLSWFDGMVLGFLLGVAASAIAALLALRDRSRDE